MSTNFSQIKSVKEIDLKAKGRELALTQNLSRFVKFRVGDGLYFSVDDAEVEQYRLAEAT